MNFDQAVAGVSVLVAIGFGLYAKGVHDGNQRPINITQTVSQSNTNQSSGGPGGIAGSIAGVLLPLAGFGALIVIAVAAISAGAQSTAQVSAVSQQAINAQSQIVREMPKPQPPVIVDRPVVVQPATAASNGASLTEVATAIISIVNLGLASIIVISAIKNKRRSNRIKNIRRISLPRHASKSENKSIDARAVFGAVGDKSTTLDRAALPEWIRLPDNIGTR